MSNVYLDDVIKIAKEEDGYLEKKSNKDLDSKTKNAGNKNYTKYARDLYSNCKSILNGNKQGASYCAVGIIWAVAKASGWSIKDARYTLCLPSSPCAAAGVKYFKNYFVAAKRYDKKPQVGDVIFFNTDKDSDPEHVGMVISVTSSQVKTEEWNTSSGGKHGVFQKTYSKTSSKILGYGHPRYSTKTVTQDTKTDSNVVIAPPKVDRNERVDSTTNNTPNVRLIKAKQPASSGPAEELNRNFKVKSWVATIKDGPSSNASVLMTIPNGKIVRCYGYYTSSRGIDWLYVRYEDSETSAYEGFICETSLEVV